MDSLSSKYRRKWRFRRGKYTALTDVALAAAVVAAVHFVLFTVFKYKEPEKSIVSKNSTVTFYRADSESENSWLKIHDPKLAVRGDSAKGFCSFMPAKEPRKITAANFNDGIDMPEIKQVINKPLKTVKAALPVIPKAQMPEKEYSRKVVVMDAAGNLLDIDMSKITPEKFGTSRFVLRGKGAFRRVETVQSCASLQDHLAANILIETGLPENEHITVVWREVKK